MGKHLDYRQETLDETARAAKAESNFSDRLYDILLAHQRGEKLRGRHPEGIPQGNVGDLDAQHSRLYNLIWSAGLNLKLGEARPVTQQPEAIAA